MVILSFTRIYPQMIVIVIATGVLSTPTHTKPKSKISVPDSVSYLDHDSPNRIEYSNKLESIAVPYKTPDSQDLRNPSIQHRIPIHYGYNGIFPYYAGSGKAFNSYVPIDESIESTSDHSSLERLMTDKIITDRLIPDRLTSDKLSSNRLVPDKFTPNRFALDKLNSNRFGLDRVTPDRLISPDRIISPDRLIYPERLIHPDQLLPPDRLPQEQAMTSNKLIPGYGKMTDEELKWHEKNHPELSVVNFFKGYPREEMQPKEIESTKAFNDAMRAWLGKSHKFQKPFEDVPYQDDQYDSFNHKNIDVFPIRHVPDSKSDKWLNSESASQKSSQDKNLPKGHGRSGIHKLFGGHKNIERNIQFFPLFIK